MATTRAPKASQQDFARHKHLCSLAFKVQRAVGLDLEVVLLIGPTARPKRLRGRIERVEIDRTLKNPYGSNLMLKLAGQENFVHLHTVSDIRRPRPEEATGG